MNTSANVTRVFGNTSAGSTDGNAVTRLTNVTFNRPMGIAMCRNGILYVADSLSHKIRSINISTHVVSTLAGSGKAGYKNDVGRNAMFHTPHAVACSPDARYVFVADTYNHRVRRVDTRTGMTATIAGDGADLHRDGTGTTPSAAQKAGSLNMPFGVAACPNGRCLFVSDHHNRAVRVVDLEHAYQLRTKPDGLSTTRDNKELGVQKYVPEEDLYVAALRTLVGSGLENDMDGAGRTAGFYGPAGIGISPDNQHLFVCDREGNRIRQVTLEVAAPTTPVGPLLYSKTATSFTISWTGSAAVPLVDRYEIQYRELSGLHVALTSSQRGPNRAVRSEWRTVTRLAQSGSAIHRPSAVLYDLLPHTSYGIRVRAQNYVGWSQWSWETLMTTGECGNSAMQWIHADGSLHSISPNLCKEQAPTNRPDIPMYVPDGEFAL